MTQSDTKFIDHFCRGCFKRLPIENYYIVKGAKKERHHFCIDCEKTKGWDLNFDKMRTF